MSNAMDVLDILDLEEASPRKSLIDKEALLARAEKKPPKPFAAPKRPDHVPREVWGLQTTLHNDLPPLMPALEQPKYNQPKAVIGVGRVRKWHWTPFTNTARQDGLVLHHWRHENEDRSLNAEYKFARYNKHATVPSYTPAEYSDLQLQHADWSEAKTDHLMQLARQFDVNFIHMRDRWNADKYGSRPSLEDMKERYYDLLDRLDKVRGTSLLQGLRYDAVHERKRKTQLSLLYGRTRDQVDEERRLVAELKQIEARRRDRERKKQDLQKLISQAASINTSESIDSFSHQYNNPPSDLASSQHQRKRGLTSTSSSSSLFDSVNLTQSSSTADSQYQMAGNHLSSASNMACSALAMKLPSNLGQKKVRIIENFLAHLQIDPSPPATEHIVEAYNQLRCKILLLYDLRLALIHCNYELQTAKLRLEAFAPGQALPPGLAEVTQALRSDINPVDPSRTSSSSSSQVLDSSILAGLRLADSKRPLIPRQSVGIAGRLDAAAGSSPPVTSDLATAAASLAANQQQRHRRAAAVQQGRVMKKLKVKGQLVD